VHGRYAYGDVHLGLEVLGDHHAPLMAAGPGVHGCSSPGGSGSSNADRAPHRDSQARHLRAVAATRALVGDLCEHQVGIVRPAGRHQQGCVRSAVPRGARLRIRSSRVPRTGKPFPGPARAALSSADELRHGKHAVRILGCRLYAQLAEDAGD
jgi:hypothetical protein